MTTPRSLEAYPIVLENDAKLDVSSDGDVILVDCDGYTFKIDDCSLTPMLDIRGDTYGICLYVGNVLDLIDEYTLNTTANDLRAQLAAANETIAQLRKADTVRPEPNYMDV
jgi:hypothetical protein